MSTRITSETPTYDLIQDGKMVHTGYFITSNNYRLKYATKWVWENMKKLPLFEIDMDRFMVTLKDAQ